MERRVGTSFRLLSLGDRSLPSVGVSPREVELWTDLVDDLHIQYTPALGVHSRVAQQRDTENNEMQSTRHQHLQPRCRSSELN